MSEPTDKRLAPAEPISFPGDVNSVKANRMATLLSIEAAAREATTRDALAIHLVNDPRALTPYDQAFCVRKTGGDQFQVIAITSQTKINAHAPHVQLVERFAQEISRTENPEQNFNFHVESITTEWKREQKLYPFKHWSWLPILAPAVSGNRELLGGLLVSRQTPWRNLDLIVLKRIVETYAHAWTLIRLARKQSTPERRKRRGIAAGLAAAIALAMFVPVPYSVVVPAQIIAADPIIISAPIDGVIKTIHVDPDQPVLIGQQLVTFIDTTLRNNAEIADNELLLALERRANTNRAAIIDTQQRRDIAVLEAEKTLAQTKRIYANDLLANIEIRASVDGIALFADKASLSGKPVVTGEKIMEIANPAAMEIVIEVPPSDALALQIGQPVNIFLDTDPLKSIKGKIIRANFTPSEGQAGQLVYKGFVALDEAPNLRTRIGLRGSAKLNAGKTTLGYWLFRKPISIARRQLGL